MILWVFYLIRQRLNYKDLCRLTSCKGELTFSYLFCCLTTETVKYINENCFIENVAASKYSMWAQRGKQML